MTSKEQAKAEFAQQLSAFAETLAGHITCEGEWTVKGFIDLSRNVHTISSDTKIVSKVLELHLFPHVLAFATSIGYTVELAKHQNYYPDITLISIQDPQIKFAVDLKTTYRLEEYPGFCNGFTLGSHGKYFISRDSTKNIQYPYNQYSGHFCLGIIYSRAKLDLLEETRTYSIDKIEQIPSVAKEFIFFACEKWRIASDKEGSSNTANIGSIQKIDDIVSGNGMFAKAGEAIFDDYWANYKKILIDANGNRRVFSSLREYLTYHRLPDEYYNPKASRRKRKTDE